jgi:hypothetical protein
MRHSTFWLSKMLDVVRLTPTRTCIQDNAFSTLHGYLKCQIFFVSNKNMHLRMHINKKLFFQPISSTQVHFLSSLTHPCVECLMKRERANLHEMTTGKAKCIPGCIDCWRASLACTVRRARHFTDSYVSLKISLIHQAIAGTDKSMSGGLPTCHIHKRAATTVYAVFAEQTRAEQQNNY